MWHRMLLMLTLDQSAAASVGGIKRELTCPLSTLSLEHGGSTLTHLAAPQRQTGLVNCSWYSTSTCCSAEDTLRITHDANPEIQLSGMLTRGCRDTLTMLQCASCSPNQQLLYAQEHIRGFEVRVLRACQSFCDRLHKSCGEATITAGGRTDRVDALFATGLSFCQAVGLQTVTKAEDAVCFSDAATWRRGSLKYGGLSLLLATFASRLLLVSGAR